MVTGALEGSRSLFPWRTIVKTNRQQQIESLHQGLHNINAHLKDLAALGIDAHLERDGTTGDYRLLVPKGTKLD
jgi:hypothetical protein